MFGFLHIKPNIYLDAEMFLMVDSSERHLSRPAIGKSNHYESQVTNIPFFVSLISILFVAAL